MKLETYFCAVIYPEVVCTAESSGNLCFAAVAQCCISGTIRWHMLLWGLIWINERLEHFRTAVTVVVAQAIVVISFSRGQ